MIRLLWSTEIHGSVEHADAASILTAPRFGDGSWRGGWWARYERDTGNRVWRRYHRRGARLFAVVEDVVVATTHKYSGVYAISYATGRRLWSRLGYHCNLLLKLLDYLPCDNEGDGPLMILGEDILTRGGSLLDHHTGRVISRHSVRWNDKHTEVDSVPVEVFREPRYRYGGMSVIPEGTRHIGRLLAQEGLEVSGPRLCVIQKYGQTIVIGCIPPPGLSAGRIYQPSKPMDVPHYLLVIRSGDNSIVHREELGLYYYAEIAWADQKTLAVTLQTKRQWFWSYRRDLRVYEVALN